MSLGMNVHQLLRVHHTRRPDGQIIKRYALIDQLAGAVHPSGSSRSGGSSGAALPINADAVETQQQILHTAQQEEAERAGLAGGMTVILKRWSLEDRPDWVAHLEHVTLDFIDTIENLLDPAPARRPLGQPCPSCGTEWVTNTEGDRKPALTAGVYTHEGGILPADEWDIACTGCGARWEAIDPAFKHLLHALTAA